MTTEPAVLATTAPTDLDALTARMAAQHLAPLWELYEQLVVREPTRPEPSMLWAWNELSPLIAAAGDSVLGERADHRVLLLRNPALGGRLATTPTLLAGIQCVQPGETTVEHRHTASDCRVVLEGAGGGTFVHGVRCDMRPGDLIVTPNWAWHRHHNDDHRRVVWVDVLDIPLIAHLDAGFGARGPAAGYPGDISTLPDPAFAAGGLLPESDRAAPGHTPRLRYPWTDVVTALASVPRADDGSRRMRYSNPLNGGPILPTIDATVIDLAHDRETQRARTTANALAIVIEGEGVSRIGAHTHAWKPRDVFTLPHWTWVTHSAQRADARLIVFSDRGILRRLGLYREEVAP